jgi:hypothetical protein
LNLAFSKKLEKEALSEENYGCRTENNILEPKRSK